MKKLLIFFAVVGIALCVSCKKETPEPPEEPSVPVWRTTHHSYSTTIDSASPYCLLESLKERYEKEVSVVIPEEEASLLSFKEDGTGFGSGVRDDGSERYSFQFTWQVLDELPYWPDEQPSEDRRWLSITKTNGDFGMFFGKDWFALEGMTWEIEEFADDRMVLVTYQMGIIDGDVGWQETKTFRYTFEKTNSK